MILPSVQTPSTSETMSLMSRAAAGMQRRFHHKEDEEHEVFVLFVFFVLFVVKINRRSQRAAHRDPPPTRKSDRDSRHAAFPPEFFLTRWRSSLRNAVRRSARRR